MMLFCFVNRECTTPPSCLEIPTPSVCIAGGQVGGCVMGEAEVWLALLQLLLCPGNTSVLPYGLDWGGKLNFCCYSEQNSDGDCSIQRLQLSLWDSRFILRIRVRKRTGCFGKLYLCC